MIRANLAGKHLPGLGAITALASSDQNTSGAAAALGTLGGLSTLTSELDASRRGFKMLRGAGGSRAQALKAFIGVPTYALSTAMPWLAYKGKEMMGGFKTKQAGLPSRQLWTLLASAKKLRGSMGSDTADRFISGHTGSGLKPSLSQFFSRPEVQGLGIHKRTPAKKILALLAASKTPTPALPKNTKLVQAELPGFGGLAKTPPPR
jgi:hypothetical protein